ncbi:MAG: hypothetical protein II811_02235 [Spirochaetaceae bacterium]|nr:hypothetical protein [Spirochaetaceae bacterium]
MELEFSISQIENLCYKKDISILPIKAFHLDELERLPKIHNDPFDQLIICQARTVLYYLRFDVYDIEMEV